VQRCAWDVVVVPNLIGSAFWLVFANRTCVRDVIGIIGEYCISFIESHHLIVGPPFAEAITVFDHEYTKLAVSVAGASKDERMPLVSSYRRALKFLKTSWKALLNRLTGTAPDGTTRCSHFLF
jgi:hypothetical protein